MSGNKRTSSRRRKSTVTIKRSRKKNVSEVYIRYSLMGAIVILAAAAGLLTSTKNADAVKEILSATAKGIESAVSAVTEFFKLLLF